MQVYLALFGGIALWFICGWLGYRIGLIVDAAGVTMHPVDPSMCLLGPIMFTGALYAAVRGSFLLERASSVSPTRQEPTAR